MSAAKPRNDDEKRIDARILAAMSSMPWSGMIRLRPPQIGRDVVPTPEFVAAWLEALKDVLVDASANRQALEEELRNRKLEDLYIRRFLSRVVPEIAGPEER